MNKSFHSQADVTNQGSRSAMPETVGNYRLLRCIGRDKSGTVYHATATDGLCVILTTLHSRMANNEAALTRFYQAARLARQLNHPNLIKGLEIGQDRGMHFFVREYLQAETLHDRLDRDGTLSEGEAVNIICAVADGVEELHEAGIVHRGLTPHSILITTGGSIKVAGLSSAKPVLEKQELPRCPPGQQAQQYMPPQQILDKFDDDIRSDTYALGATLYKLLTGETPFDGQSTAETLVRKYRHRYVSPEKLKPELSRAVVETIHQCLSATPERRPQNIAEFRQLLECETKRSGEREIQNPKRRENLDRFCRGQFADDRDAADRRLNLNTPAYCKQQLPFRGDTNLALRISHPNGVAFEAVGENDGRHYLVMELVEGETWRDGSPFLSHAANSSKC